MPEQTLSGSFKIDPTPSAPPSSAASAPTVQPPVAVKPTDKPVPKVAPKEVTRTFTEEEVTNLRSSLEPLIVHADINRWHPVVMLLEDMLKEMLLRFESGHTIPENHYLDLVHSIVVADGYYYDASKHQVVPVPEGMRYDRKTATLSKVPPAATVPTCPHRTDGGYCAICRVTVPTMIEAAEAERLKKAEEAEKVPVHG